MEKEINIAAILRDKPEGTKLWSPISGDCKFCHVNTDIDDSICVERLYDHLKTEFAQNGKSYPTGEIMLFPSKNMRDWKKFAWKKGDVLKYKNYKDFFIFVEWANEDYTYFVGKDIDGNRLCITSKAVTINHHKATQEEADKFISKIEKACGGKLNLNTLEIEKPQFKDGDIVVISDDYNKSIAIFKKSCGKEVSTYVELTPNHNNQLCFGNAPYKLGLSVVRMAKEKEKQQLFAALEKEGKAWDAEKKQIVDLPKKCEFKPFDKVLMRDFGETWKLCQFGFMEIEPVRVNSPYNAVGGNWYNECIPYNEETKRLLGTTDEWKGGENG